MNIPTKQREAAREYGRIVQRYSHATFSDGYLMLYIGFLGFELKRKHTTRGGVLSVRSREHEHTREPADAGRSPQGSAAPTSDRRERRPTDAAAGGPVTHDDT